MCSLQLGLRFAVQNHSHGARAACACHLLSAARLARKAQSGQAVGVTVMSWHLKGFNCEIKWGVWVRGLAHACLQVVLAASSASRLSVNSFVCRRQRVTSQGNMQCSRSAARFCVEGRNILIDGG